MVVRMRGWVGEGGERECIDMIWSCLVRLHLSGSIVRGPLQFCRDMRQEPLVINRSVLRSIFLLMSLNISHLGHLPLSELE